MKIEFSLPFTEIRKRDGTLVSFDPSKIKNAIAKAGKATGEFDHFEAEILTIQTIKVLTHSHRSGIPEIEQVQDIVEHVLFFDPRGSADVVNKIVIQRCKGGDDLIDLRSKPLLPFLENDFRADLDPPQVGEVSDGSFSITDLHLEDIGKRGGRIA